MSSTELTTPIGANTWIWESPITDAAPPSSFRGCAHWGFDLVELQIETSATGIPHGPPSCWPRTGSAPRSASRWPRARSLAAPTTRRSPRPRPSCATASTRRRPWARASSSLIYASVGRTWRMAPGERSAISASSRASRPSANMGPNAASTRRRAPRPVRDERHQHRRPGTRGHPRPAPRGRGSARRQLPRQRRGTDVADAFRRAGDRLAHVHLCANDRGAPGPTTSTGPASQCARRHRYDGAVVIESFTAENEAIAAAASSGGHRRLSRRDRRRRHRAPSAGVRLIGQARTTAGAVLPRTTSSGVIAGPTRESSTWRITSIGGLHAALAQLLEVLAHRRERRRQIACERNVVKSDDADLSRYLPARLRHRPA